ncbi:uncharacterized protein YqjF (DUF2071 family) [Catalinimonas alkaloidigena]|uniref:YqjF family protein n=1 Tax=Catalinimonas alkaloidigena TaxID=1075417 RepID=UPI0024060054|nr:DUF2071 domain-containing protein [Catalinimonas alkaloidigena]MDF9795443.1 uncharacterized protein YqjF (DUF2071 family) [Catalinimonas alkaloidigena]
MSFLSAEWRKLALANYIVDKKLLSQYVPAGTELDFWEGRCYVSLIGFMFQNTRLLGIKVPFHVNFEEVNLRFYVKRLEHGEWKRGVVFIKEIVPKWALAFVANSLYKENYESLPMKHVWATESNQRIIEYTWKRLTKWNKFQVQASIAHHEMESGSEAEFITEHYWGYAKVNDHKTNEYEVTHPRWKTYQVIDYQIDVDFEANYGPAFGFLKHEKPVSVMLAEGSEITVEKKKAVSI